MRTHLENTYKKKFDFGLIPYINVWENGKRLTNMMINAASDETEISRFDYQNHDQRRLNLLYFIK